MADCNSVRHFFVRIESSSSFVLPRTQMSCPKSGHVGHSGAGLEFARPTRNQRHLPCSERTRARPQSAVGPAKGLMPTRVFLFFGVIAVTTIICYLQRYRPPEQVRLRRRKLDVPFNDSGCLTELDD